MFVVVRLHNVKDYYLTKESSITYRQDATNEFRLFWSQDRDQAILIKEEAGAERLVDELNKRISDHIEVRAIRAAPHTQLQPGVYTQS